jgi:ankyrin repeat protein
MERESDEQIDVRSLLSNFNRSLHPMRSSIIRALVFLTLALAIASQPLHAQARTSAQRKSLDGLNLLGVPYVLDALSLLRGTNGLSRLALVASRMQGDALAWAINTRRSKLAEWLLDARLNPNAKDSSGMSPLLHAVITEDWSLAARLVAAGADPNATSPESVSALMLTAAAGNVDLLDALVRSGADLEAADSKKRRAVHYAAAARKHTTLERLLAANARVEGVTADGGDIFAMVAQSRDWSFMEPILQRFTSRSWDSPARMALQDALSARHVDRLRLVLSKHPGPATAEGCKDPLLAYAIVRNDLETVRLLLEAGADPNTSVDRAEQRLLEFVPHKFLRHYLTNERGMTALTVAAGMGNQEALRLLLDHGAEKNRPTRSKHRLIPLYFAAWGNHPECIQTLIGNAPSPDQFRIEISLATQSATLYKNNVLAFRTEISSGQSETPTPKGRFVITDKKRHHVSNLYDADMPYFMRLSCKDFGMHEGHLPGYPASHGCIRLPGSSARKLFREVPIGTLVTIR